MLSVSPRLCLGVGFSCALFLLTASSARAELPDTGPLSATQADSAANGALTRANADARRALAAKRGPRVELNQLYQRGTIPRSRLDAALTNQYAGRYLGTAIRDLSRVEQVAGAARVIKRLGQAENDGEAIGPAFELRVAAELGPELKAMSVDIDGHEIDAVLWDGTVVEMKHFDSDPHIRAEMLTKAVKQLELRGQNGAPLLLVSNRALSHQEKRMVRSRLGKRISFRVVHGFPPANAGWKQRHLRKSDRGVARVRRVQRKRAKANKPKRAVRQRSARR